MHQYQAKIDSIVTAGAVSTPAIANYLDMVKEGAGWLAVVMGCVLATGRVILMFRDWNKSKGGEQ